MIDVWKRNPILGSFFKCRFERFITVLICLQLFWWINSNFPYHALVKHFVKVDYYYGFSDDENENGAPLVRPTSPFKRRYFVQDNHCLLIESVWVMVHNFSYHALVKNWRKTEFFIWFSASKSCVFPPVFDCSLDLFHELYF